MKQLAILVCGLFLNFTQTSLCHAEELELSLPRTTDETVVIKRSQSSELVFYVQAHYTKKAYGKIVSSVMAHSGILMQDGPPTGLTAEKLYWADVKDTYLLEKGDHFAGKFILSGKDNEFGPFLRYPVIQYWVTFTDGSRYYSDIYKIPVTQTESVSTKETFQLHRDNRELAFDRLIDTDFTQAQELRYVENAPQDQ